MDDPKNEPWKILARLFNIFINLSSIWKYNNTLGLFNKNLVFAIYQKSDGTSCYMVLFIIYHIIFRIIPAWHSK